LLDQEGRLALWELESIQSWFFDKGVEDKSEGEEGLKEDQYRESEDDIPENVRRNE